MSDNKDELEKEELKDVNSNETSKDNKEDDYEKICYVCRRPESKAGKMIDMPGGICVCTDCLQKSFNNFQNVGMNVNISEEELKNLLNMPGVHMMNPEDFIRNVPHKQKIKKKKADQKFVKDVEARKYYEREFSKDLKGLDATERKAKLNKIMNDAVKYRQEGVTDNAVIAKAMKLDRNDRTNKDNIAAAIMANKAKDMDSMEKYQKQLEKYIPKDRASNITDKARKIGGLSIK